MIYPALAAAAMILALSACQAATEDPGSAAGAATLGGSTVAAATPSTVPVPDPFAIRAERDRTDLVAGCPGMNPEQRPRGSNCFGIFPEQCGADRAAAFREQPLTADLRQRIEAIHPPGGIRFIRPDEPVTDDLRLGRLNVHLDRQGRIDTVDCY